MSTSRTPVAIIGASGYTGSELVRILTAHPHVELVAICARRAAGQRLAEVFPQFTGRVEMPIEAFDADAVAARAPVAFSALPHGDSAEVCAALRARGGAHARSVRRLPAARSRGLARLVWRRA